MITIQLNNLLFYSYHGIYPEEKIIGNEYEINAEIKFHEEEEQVTSLQQTIDYVDLYEIIKKQMNIPSLLLETIVSEIGNNIVSTYKNISSATIQIRKVHPPIAGFQGSVSVAWSKEFLK